MRGWLAVVLAVGLLVATPSVTVAAPSRLATGEMVFVAAEVPDTPPGRQIAWLIDASHRVPISEAEVREHLTAGLLELLPVAEFNAGLAAISGSTGLTAQRYREPTAQSAQVIATSDTGAWLIGISVDAAGLIGNISVFTRPPVPTSWSEIDQRLAALAPEVSMLVARLDEGTGRCRPVHGLAAGDPHPLGSAFKLYVLGTLAHEVAAGRAGWDEPLAIRDDWKSLPSGVFQDLPAGTILPLRRYAENMIAISDNTATDHLINRLGRRRVEAQQVRFGIRDRLRNTPFLTTRELFQMKLIDYPTYTDGYAAQPSPAARRSYLANVVDLLPLPSLEDAQEFTEPRAIDTVEWFASPRDICRAFAGLSRQAASPDGEPVAQALARNDGGLWLDPVWTTTWFKGGSEPGVITLNYLARTGSAAFVASVMLTNTTSLINEITAVGEAGALIRGGLALAAGLPPA
jgi:beta-lactamase class A